MGATSTSESLEDDLETTLARNEQVAPDKQTTFHFVGIRQPFSLRQEQKRRKSTMFDVVKPTSITSRIQLTDNVSTFKKFIRDQFQLPQHRDILIIYSNLILHDWQKSLLDYGITDQSCFLLALHDNTERDKLKLAKEDKQTAKEVDKSLKRMRIQSKKSLDIVTQEENVDVFKMHGCEHSMNKDSLYQYSLSQFMNKKEKIKCPHTHCQDEHGKHNGKDDGNALCQQEWNYPMIKQYLLAKHENGDKQALGDGDQDEKESAIDEQEAARLMKLELLLSRNYVENKFNLQKCPCCHTIYYRGSKVVTKIRVRCILCATEFCWRCNGKWKENHMCQSAFRDHTLNILRTCSKKMIKGKSTPSIRACPNCTQLITHTEGL